MNTRQQRWSRSAHEAVCRFAEDKAQAPKIKTFCMKMPALIQRSGTVQSLAFVISRGKEGIAFTDALARTYSGADGKNLLAQAQKADLRKYLALTRDLLEVASWYRRFAQIEMAGVKEEEGQ